MMTCAPMPRPDRKPPEAYPCSPEQPALPTHPFSFLPRFLGFFRDFNRGGVVFFYNNASAARYAELCRAVLCCATPCCASVPYHVLCWAAASAPAPTATTTTAAKC
jgi:hypothetical protein